MACSTEVNFEKQFSMDIWTLIRQCDSWYSLLRSELFAPSPSFSLNQHIFRKIRQNCAHVWHIIRWLDCLFMTPVRHLDHFSCRNVSGICRFLTFRTHFFGTFWVNWARQQKKKKKKTIQLSFMDHVLAFISEPWISPHVQSTAAHISVCNSLLYQPAPFWLIIRRGSFLLRVKRSTKHPH